MQGKENNPLYSAAMDLIVRANWSVYKEGVVRQISRGPIRQIRRGFCPG